MERSENLSLLIIQIVLLAGMVAEAYFKRYGWLAFISVLYIGNKLECIGVVIARKRP